MAGSPYEPVGGRAPRTKRRWLCFGLFLASGLLCAVVAWLFAWKPVPLPHAPESRNDRDARLKGITAAWVPFEAHEHPDQPTSLWGKIQRPYPTGAWWTNLVVGGPNNMGEGLGGAMATPYAVQIDGKKGVSLAYGLVTPGNDSLTLSVQPDLGVTIDEGISDRYVVAADDLTMAMRLETETKGKFADVLLARGSPYVTFRFEGATPAFHSDMRFESLDAVQAGAGNETAAVDPTVTVTAKTATRDKSGVPQECSARPSCVEAVLKGDCCPMPSGSYHGCCATPLESQGPATTFLTASRCSFGGEQKGATTSSRKGAVSEP